jgi:hypothetical protein
MVSVEQIITQALGLPPEAGLLILALVSTIVFYVHDFRIGLLSSFIITAIVYLIAYYLKWNTSLVLSVMLIFVVLLALSIYLTGARAKNPMLVR